MNRLTVLAVGAVAIAVSCGVAGDGELERIDSADLFGLDETTTSTTTSTTTTTIAAPTSFVESTVGVTSTTIATEPVVLYFVDGNRLADVSIDLARSPSPSRVVAALLSGPPSGEVGIGLRSLLSKDLTNTVVPSGTGFVTVDIVGDEFERIDPADQRGAIGQIVLTLTERPGIGQVRFTQDGAPMRVLRQDGLQSDPGEAVSRLDYESLLDVVEPETTTATTAVPVDTTMPSSTAPPST